MASQTQTDDGLATTYETHLGDSSTRSEARGYGMVALGAILGILGMGLLLTNQSAGGVRELAVVLASTGLLLLFAGPVVRLPLERTATYIVAVGMAIATVAIVWFVAAYPGQWSTQTGNLTIIFVYAVGALVVISAGAFVPVLTGREGGKAHLAALHAELDDLKQTAGESDADAADLTEDIAELQNALAASDAENADLGSEVTQLEADVADTEADESDLAVLLGEHRSSQSQFELYEDRGGAWRWRLRHRDGEVIAGSNEGQPTRNEAQRTMQAVKRDAHGAGVLQVESEEELPEAGTTEGFVVGDDVESQATFECYEDDGGGFRWRLRHDNGTMLGHGGQGYESRDGVEHSVEKLRDYVGPAEYLELDPTGIEVYADEEGKWRWRLRHRNGNVLAGSGEGYESRVVAGRVVDRLREEIGDLEIDVYEDEAGGFRWRLTGSDDLVEADSNGYESRQGAEKAVDRVRKFLPEADLIDVGQSAFEIYVDEGGANRWRLRHRNGNVIASSGDGYASRRNVMETIESVKRHAPDAGFEETDG